jgi:hypothetical protein
LIVGDPGLLAHSDQATWLNHWLLQFDGTGSQVIFDELDGLRVVHPRFVIAIFLVVDRFGGAWAIQTRLLGQCL